MNEQPGEERHDEPREVRAWCAGSAQDPAQDARLFEAVYAELRRLAERCMADERGEHTLQPTALVHEAYLELVGTEDGRDPLPFSDRQRFLAVAARAMRRTLIDHARGRGRQKRGGDWQRVALDPNVAPVEEPLDFEVLDRALEALRERSEELTRLVELRFFAGLSVEETARALGSSERTVRRDWTFARAWLQRWIKEHDG